MQQMVVSRRESKRDMINHVAPYTVCAYICMKMMVMGFKIAIIGLHLRGDDHPVILILPLLARLYELKHCCTMYAYYGTRIKILT